MSKFEDYNFAGGKGTRDNPYLISNAQELYNIRYCLNKSFKQIANIDLSAFVIGSGWKPLGHKQEKFSGNYNGNNFSIFNLYIDSPESQDLGLFGAISEYSRLENIKLEKVKIIGNSYVGGLVGWNEGELSNCSVQGIIKADKDVGGLIGSNLNVVMKSRARVNVYGIETVGGLIGGNTGIIIGTYAKGNINGDKFTGGLVGGNDGTISRSFSESNVSGQEFIGGLIGANLGMITYSYSNGKVAGKVQVGGFAGINDGQILNSYYNKKISGQCDTGKGIPTTNAKMLLKNQD
ncbi:MAG: GLUG motif-containing protein [Halarsenatibacteraceae bacterium]